MQVPALLALATALAAHPTQAVLTDTHQCLVEVGYDYIANDIGNATSATADGCCEKCEATPDCRAYSWTDQANGTCWLKSGRGTVVQNLYVQSATVQPLEVSDTDDVGGCHMDEGIDYVGNDVGVIPTAKKEDCCDLCSGTSGCRAFTFTSHEGGTCWLKSAKGPMVANPDAFSAQVFLETPSCGIEYGVDYVGNDIGSVPASEPDACCGVCTNWEGCRAWSWVWLEGQGGTCFLKNRKDATVAKEWVHSGQVQANPAAPSCALELDVDYVGNDIGSAWSADPYGCCSKCMATKGCKAFSWSDYEGGTCWLKSSKGSAVASLGVKSAIL
jgi:hypothetical protein